MSDHQANILGAAKAAETLRAAGFIQPAAVIEAQATEIERLREDCAEAYQVVGSLAARSGLLNDAATAKALANLMAAAGGWARPHEDLLPFIPGKPVPNR